MNPSKVHVRVILAAIYVCLTLPVLPFLGFNLPWVGILFVFLDFGLRALPLYLTVRIDRAFYDGGELSPELMPFWIILTAIMLSPMLLVSARPSVWNNQLGRRAIMLYACTVCLLTAIAASWVYRHLGVFL